MPKPDDIETRFRTAGHFTEALKKNLFALFCQPIVSVESAKVDYKYMEIFVRFREEEDKLLPPGTFFLKHKAKYETSLLDEFRLLLFFFQAEDGIRDLIVTGVQTCALPI